jgi:hypothetical protein
MNALTYSHIVPASAEHKGWRDVVDLPFPSAGTITEETKNMTAAYSEHFRGSVRISLNRIFTTREFENFRKRVYSKSLP